jgi:nicotinate-nucleotide adenylyltransferase
VLFMPTGSPHYREPAKTPGEHRVAMLKLALDGEPRFAIDARELSASATGYTVDTLRSLRRDYPKDEMFLVIGSDQHAKFESWREPDEVARLARLAVAARPGFAIKGRQAAPIPFTPTPVSASDIRARAARGGSLAGLVPAPVEKYINQHKLYR